MASLGCAKFSASTAKTPSFRPETTLGPTLAAAGKPIILSTGRS